MGTLWAITATVVGGLLLERIVVTRVTRSPRGREWVRRQPLLHPNGISIVRMPMGLVCIAFAARGWWVFATLWFSFWMISDLTDGTIARNCDLATEIGKWLDPLSDKFMYFPAIIFCAVPGNTRITLPWISVVAFLVIDAVGQLSRLFIQKTAANFFGKAKTAFVTILLALTALDQIHALWFMSEGFVSLIMLSCVVLAFLSAYCKAVPDEWYANTLTLANFLCGIAAIGSVYAGHPLRAFVLVFLGQFFDLFDGRLARIFGSTRHGPMFDDVADGTSFGAATAYLVMTELSKHLPIAIAVSLAVFYVGCVIYRLHRFLHPKVALPDGVFDGMPSPAGALLAAASALLFGSRAPWLAALLVAAASLLMISHLRYRHFARSIWPALPRAIKPVICIVAIIFADAALAHKLPHVSFSLCCFLIGLAYTFYGIDFRFYRGTRKTPATRTQTAPAGEG